MHIEVVAVAFVETIFLISIHKLDGAVDHMCEHLTLACLYWSQLKIGDHNERLQVLVFFLKEERAIAILLPRSVKCREKLRVCVGAASVDNDVKILFTASCAASKEV